MASWESLRGYVKANYKVSRESSEQLALDFDLSNGRTQRVLVRRAGEAGGAEWAEIQTAVGAEKDLKLDARSLLAYNSGFVVGGLALVGTDADAIVIFRHSFPLADLDPSEFEGPLSVVVRCGDELELELTGQDRF